MRAIASAVAILLVATPAAAQQGALGPTSQASVTITVSVAPRVRLTALRGGRGELCVATGREFEIVLAEGSAPVTWEKLPGGCPMKGTRLQVTGKAAVGQATLLIRPE